MTFEKALVAMKSGKKVRIKSWNHSEFAFVMKGEIYLHNKSGSIIKLWELYDPDRTLLSTENDWEIVEDAICMFDLLREIRNKKEISATGLTCNISMNIDEFEQALDKFRCRLEDLQEAAKELNSLELKCSISVGDKGDSK